MAISLSVPEFLRSMASTYSASQQGLQAGQQQAAAAQAQAAAAQAAAEQQATANAQKQQQINIAAAQQAASQRNEEAQRTMAQQQADRTTYAGALDLLSDPDRVGQLSTQPAGRARLHLAHAAINQFGQQYGWPVIPNEADVADPATAAQLATEVGKTPPAAAPNAPASAPPTAAAVPPGFAPSPVRGTPNVAPEAPPNQPASAGPQPSSGVSVGAVPPPLASVGAVPAAPQAAPAGKGQPAAPTAGAPPPAPFQVAPPNVPQKVPGAPAVPGLPDFTPAAKALLSFDPRAEVDQLRAKFPNLSLGAAQKMASDNLGMLRQAAQGSEDASLFPYKILQAGLTAGLTDAQIQNTLATAGYTLQKPELDQMKAKLAAQKSTAQQGLEAQKFQEAQRHNMADEANVAAGHQITAQGQANTVAENLTKNQQAFLTGVQHAGTVANGEARQKIMALRGDLQRLQYDAWQQEDRITTGGANRIGAGLHGSVTASGQESIGLGPWARETAGVRGTVGGNISGSMANSMRDQQGRVLHDTPAARAYWNALKQIDAIASSPQAYVPQTFTDAMNITKPPTPQEQAMVQQSLNPPKGSRVQSFADLVNYYKSAKPSYALRLIQTYRAVKPGQPLPDGVDIGDILGLGSRNGAAQPATAPAVGVGEGMSRGAAGPAPAR